MAFEESHYQVRKENACDGGYLETRIKGVLIVFVKDLF